MKKRVLKFERFLVWCFEMDAGERKPVRAIEANRNLGGNLLNAIAFPIRGRFNVVQSGHPAIEVKPGGGAWPYVETLDGLAVEALEDDSEYHCITPRDKEPKHWHRTVTLLRPGEKLTLAPGAFLYLPKQETVVEADPHTRVVTCETEQVVVAMRDLT